MCPKACGQCYSETEALLHLWTADRAQVDCKLLQGPEGFHLISSISTGDKPSRFSLPSFLFDLGAGDAGEPGDLRTASAFVGVTSLRSTPFFAGDAICGTWSDFGGLRSDFGGLLSPSGSGLVAFVSRCEWGAAPTRRHSKNK